MGKVILFIIYVICAMIMPFSPTAICVLVVAVFVSYIIGYVDGMVFLYKHNQDEEYKRSLSALCNLYNCHSKTIMDNQNIIIKQTAESAESTDSDKSDKMGL